MSLYFHTNAFRSSNKIHRIGSSSQFPSDPPSLVLPVVLSHHKLALATITIIIMIKTTLGLLLLSSRSTAFHAALAARSPYIRGGSQLAALPYADSDEQLPEFASEQDYLDYMMRVSALPKGFSTGTASGKFVSVEAPALGQLPIRATVIHLTEGPTQNWAAVFTSNKVGVMIV